MTHAELIKKLGGGDKVAKRLSELAGEEINREAVYKWRELDHIPWRWRPYVVSLAREKGARLPKDFLPGVVAA